MSSHREAPAISKDPVADNTDLYAFVSPDDPGTVTHHLQLPAARGAVRRPELLRVRRRRPLPHQHRQRRRRRCGHHLRVRVPDRRSRNPNTFLYNTGPIHSIDSANWNRKQFYSVTRISRGRRQVLGSQPGLPAVQHRSALDAELRRARRAGDAQPRRRPDRVRRSAARGLLRRPRVDLRPRRPAPVREPPHRRRMAAAAGVNATNDFSVHSIALKVPKRT